MGGHFTGRRQEVEDKKSIITLFLARFTLTEADVEAISSRDVPIGQRFFDAMDKTERIREHCRVLMAGEDGSTKAGPEIMASTFTSLEQGYEKILRYCSHEIRQVGRDSQLEVSPQTHEAVLRRRKRPELLTLALLSTTLKEITDVTYKVFYDSIDTQSQALSRIHLDENDPSLTPPLAILDHAQILREVMLRVAYQSSLLRDEDEALTKFWTS
ncbi:oligomeric complex COG6-domain-containing protein [Flammula alnicola]|nr:oligomeric complex COG6-domain-containing protein [Flammula alnicola]